MPDIGALRAFLLERANDGLLSWRDQTEAAQRFGLPCGDVEAAALEAGVLPSRYRRNQRMLTTAQQLALFRSRVAVVGCGGLGGYLLEELARLGVGHLVAIDADAFEEHNLNRQLLSTPATIGGNKALAAARRVADVNPAVDARAVQAPFSRDRAGDLFGGVDVVADALDSVGDRLELVEACRGLGLPLVHGAIAGWFGYVSTVLPGDDTLQRLYGRRSNGRGVEAGLGNPSFTPAVVASLEVAEVVKILLGTGTLLRRRVLCVNLLDMEMESVPIDTPATSA